MGRPPGSVLGGKPRLHHSGKWVVTWKPDMPGATRKYFYGGTPQEAVRKRNAWLANPLGPSPRISQDFGTKADDAATLPELFEFYRASHWPDLQPSGRKKESYYVHYIMGYEPLQGKRVIDITKTECKLFLTDLRLQYPRLSSDFHRKTFSFLRKLFQFAIDELDSMSIEDNPTDGIRLPKLQETSVEVWDAEQATLFLHLCQESYLGTLFTFLLATGARYGEAVALQWRNINTTKGLAFITKSFVLADDKSQEERNWGIKSGQRRHQRMILKPFTKNKFSTRSVELHGLCLKRLITHRQSREAIGKAGPKDLLFTGKNGGYLEPSVARKEFVALQETMGIYDPNDPMDKPDKIHSLRHTWASLNLMVGISPFELARMGGWKDTTMIMQRYGHYIRGSDVTPKSAMAKIYRQANHTQS